MDGLAPPLRLLWEVKRAMERGQSVKQGILGFVRGGNDEFSAQVVQWMALFQQGQETRGCLEGISSQYRRILLQVLERGLRGESIYNMLQQLEVEIVEACEDEISMKVARLPIFLLVPLLLFQFPAFLLLLFGPLVQNFFHSLGGG